MQGATALRTEGVVFKNPLLPSQIISVNMEHPTIKAFEHSLKIKCNELRWKNQLIAR